jgi:exosortase
MDGLKLKSAATVAGVAFVFVYWGVLVKLFHDWMHDDNYSHGVLIIPLAVFFAWQRRIQLKNAPVRPSSVGLLVVGAGLAVLLAGQLGAELFLTRVSMLITLVGAVLFVRGWPTLKAAVFPIAFLILMIPIPAIIFNQVAFPLQLLASRAGELGLNAAGVPVLREGNVMILAHTTLEVAQACSGIRSLISLLTLAIVYGYFTDSRLAVRVIIAAATVPIAIATNAMRVAGTGIAAQYFGAEAAEGFFHTFSGWLVFLVAFFLMFLTTRILLHLIPQPVEEASAVTA